MTENKKGFIEALKEMPIIQVACKRVGISRATYYRWRNEDKEFMRESDDALKQGYEFINDMSESQIVTLIKEKRLPAIALWLKHHHPKYGSRARSYTPITPIENLTPNENTILRKALNLVSGT